jgi:hypothetical protein
MKFVPASISESGFNCPHCRVLTTHRWNHCYVRPFQKKGDVPNLLKSVDDIDWSKFEKDEERKLRTFVEKLLLGFPFPESEAHSRFVHNLNNIHVSVCYHCDKASIWLTDRLLYPEPSEGPEPKPDTPDSIKADYQEAAAILRKSPRGAAALLRLCIQKLCKELGQPGKNINEDIGALVAAGLDARVQKALDAVRVIGNNAVHPGQIDLKDDQGIAETLFRLVDIIVEKMISEPKMVDEVYSNLPQNVLAQIEKRDKPKP